MSWEYAALLASQRRDQVSDEDHVALLRKDIANLRFELAGTVQSVLALEAERDALKAENEKLRTELARIREMPRVQTLLERDSLKAEVQRLREALALLKAADALQATESETGKP